MCRHQNKVASNLLLHVGGGIDAAQWLKGEALTVPEPIGAMHMLEKGIYTTSEILFSDL